MTNFHMMDRINDAIIGHKVKSTEPILAIILTKEDKAQLDDEAKTISKQSNEDGKFAETKEYQGIPIMVREFSALMIEHKITEFEQF